MLCLNITFCASTIHDNVMFIMVPVSMAYLLVYDLSHFTLLSRYEREIQNGAKPPAVAPKFEAMGLE